MRTLIEPLPAAAGERPLVAPRRLPRPTAVPRARLANLAVRRVLRAGDRDLLPFACECGDGLCRLPLWLSLPDFDALADGPGYGISPGHAA